VKWRRWGRDQRPRQRRLSSDRVETAPGAASSHLVWSTKVQEAVVVAGAGKDIAAGVGALNQAVLDVASGRVNTDDKREEAKLLPRAALERNGCLVTTEEPEARVLLGQETVRVDVEDGGSVLVVGEGDSAARPEVDLSVHVFCGLRRTDLHVKGSWSGRGGARGLT